MLKPHNPNRYRLPNLSSTDNTDVIGRRGTPTQVQSRPLPHRALGERPYETRARKLVLQGQVRTWVDTRDGKLWVEAPILCACRENNPNSRYGKIPDNRTPHHRHSPGNYRSHNSGQAVAPGRSLGRDKNNQDGTSIRIHRMPAEASTAVRRACWRSIVSLFAYRLHYQPLEWLLSPHPARILPHRESASDRP